MTRDRGKVVRDAAGRPVLPTIHPSLVLRQRDSADRQRAYAGLVADLRAAAAILAG